MILDILSEPRVLLIDDVQEEIEDIRLALNERSIPNEFVNVDIENVYHREFPLESVELIFLDLNFNKGFNAEIIPELCVQIIKDAVKEGKEYYLVIWSKDADESKEVLDLLSLHGISPVKSILRKKGLYLTPHDGYDIDRLFREINDEFSNVMEIEEIEGEILDIEEDCVIVDCVLDKEKGIIQKRKFDKLPFTNIQNLKAGNYVTIRIITKPGSKIYEFYNNSKDLKDTFNKDLFFDGIDENSLK